MDEIPGIKPPHLSCGKRLKPASYLTGRFKSVRRAGHIATYAVTDAIELRKHAHDVFICGVVAQKNGRPLRKRRMTHESGYAGSLVEPSRLDLEDLLPVQKLQVGRCKNRALFLKRTKQQGSSLRHGPVVDCERVSLVLDRHAGSQLGNFFDALFDRFRNEHFLEDLTLRLGAKLPAMTTDRRKTQRRKHAADCAQSSSAH